MVAFQRFGKILYIAVQLDRGIPTKSYFLHMILYTNRCCCPGKVHGQDHEIQSGFSSTFFIAYAELEVIIKTLVFSQFSLKNISGFINSDV